MTSSLGMAQLTKKGKTILVDGVPARDVPIFPDENTLSFKVPMVDAMMLNLLMGGAMMVYGFTSLSARNDYVRNTRNTKHVYHQFEQQRRFVFSAGADPFTTFWRKAPKEMVIAMRIVVVTDPTQFNQPEEEKVDEEGGRSITMSPKATPEELTQIYVDMMGVRTPWRGGKLMLGMLKRLVAQFPGKSLSFSPPTEAGLATIYAAQAAGLPVVMPTKMDGGGPIEPPGFKKRPLRLRVKE